MCCHRTRRQNRTLVCCNDLIAVNARRGGATRRDEWDYVTSLKRSSSASRPAVHPWPWSSRASSCLFELDRDARLALIGKARDPDRRPDDPLGFSDFLKDDVVDELLVAIRRPHRESGVGPDAALQRFAGDLERRRRHPVVHRRRIDEGREYAVAWSVESPRKSQRRVLRTRRIRHPCCPLLRCFFGMGRVWVVVAASSASRASNRRAQRARCSSIHACASRSG